VRRRDARQGVADQRPLRLTEVFGLRCWRATSRRANRTYRAYDDERRTDVSPSESNRHNPTSLSWHCKCPGSSNEQTSLPHSAHPHSEERSPYYQFVPKTEDHYLSCASHHSDDTRCSHLPLNAYR